MLTVAAPSTDPPSLFDVLDDGDPGPIEPTDLPLFEAATPGSRSGRATSTCRRG